MPKISVKELSEIRWYYSCNQWYCRHTANFLLTISLTMLGYIYSYLFILLIYICIYQASEAILSIVLPNSWMDGFTWCFFLSEEWMKVLIFYLAVVNLMGGRNILVPEYHQVLVISEQTCSKVHILVLGQQAIGGGGLPQASTAALFLPHCRCSKCRCHSWIYSLGSSLFWFKFCFFRWMSKIFLWLDVVALSIILMCVTGKFLLRLCCHICVGERDWELTP